MKVKSNTLSDVPKSKREKLKALLDERAVLSYAFSYKRLAKLLDHLDCQDIHLELAQCVLAYKEDDAKEIKDELNDRIQGLFLECDLTASETGAITLNEPDPFGNMRDFVYMKSNSTSFSQSECIAMLVRKFKLDAGKVAAVFADPKVSKKKPFVTVQCRDHKEREDSHKPKK